MQGESGEGGASFQTEALHKQGGVCTGMNSPLCFAGTKWLTMGDTGRWACGRLGEDLDSQASRLGPLVQAGDQ